MIVSPTTIGGVLRLQPTPHVDDRGFFVRTFTADALEAAGVPARDFVQHNQSRSAGGVLRGLHVRVDPGEAKTVRCARGSIFDVLVDVRPSSPTFRRWEAFVLDDVSHTQLYMPPGIAHGFLVTSELADVCYCHSSFYGRGYDLAIRWDDPQIAIEWPSPPVSLSARDAVAPWLEDVLDQLERC